MGSSLKNKSRFFATHPLSMELRKRKLHKHSLWTQRMQRSFQKHKIIIHVMLMKLQATGTLKPVKYSFSGFDEEDVSVSSTPYKKTGYDLVSSCLNFLFR